MPSHRHHFVPQFYLRNFADASGRVWRYLKSGGGPVAKFPKAVAFEMDYHTLPLKDGTDDSDTIEQLFAQMENAAAPVIKKIIDGAAVDESERMTFIAFAGALLVRVPHQRDIVGRMMNEMAKRFLQTGAYHKESFHADFRRFQVKTGHTSTVDPEAVRQAYLSDSFELKAEPHSALEMTLSSMETVVNCLLCMNWSFVRAAGRFKFITSDNPVFYCDPTIPPGTWQGVGLMNLGVEVSMPLSPEVAAFGSHRPLPRSRLECPAEGVRRLNQMRVDGADRHLFAHENSEAVQRFIQRNNDPIVPVRER